METIIGLAAYRRWQHAVADGTATGELAILLARRVAAYAGDSEALSFLQLAMVHVRQSKAAQ